MIIHHDQALSSLLVVAPTLHWCDMSSEQSPLMLCPQHTLQGQQTTSNVARNRSPMIQCCDHQSQVWRHKEMVLRNARIPSSYYTALDPRTHDMVSHMVSVSRSVSSVSIKTAGHVRLVRHHSKTHKRTPGTLWNVNNNGRVVSSGGNDLSWEYKLAGIGVCCQGRTDNIMGK